MGAVSIDLTRLELRDKDMPVVISAILVRVELNDSRRRAIVPIKQQQFDHGGASRKDAEVDTTFTNRRAQRSARTAADSTVGTVYDGARSRVRIARGHRPTKHVAFRREP